jgi:hypothetical protein
MVATGRTADVVDKDVDTTEFAKRRTDWFSGCFSIHCIGDYGAPVSTFNTHLIDNGIQITLRA